MLDFIKIKNFYSAKDEVKRVRQVIDWEKIFVKDTSDKRRIKYTSKSYKLTKKKKKH